MIFFEISMIFFLIFSNFLWFSAYFLEGRKPLCDDVTETVQNVTIPTETIALQAYPCIAVVIRRRQPFGIPAESAGI